MCESQVTFNANFFEANKVAFKPAGRQIHDNQPSQTNQPTQSTRKLENMETPFTQSCLNKHARA